MERHQVCFSTDVLEMLINCFYCTFLPQHAHLGYCLFVCQIYLLPVSYTITLGGCIWVIWVISGLRKKPQSSSFLYIAIAQEEMNSSERTWGVRFAREKGSLVQYVKICIRALNPDLLMPALWHRITFETPCETWNKILRNLVCTSGTEDAYGSICPWNSNCEYVKPCLGFPMSGA